MLDDAVLTPSPGRRDAIDHGWNNLIAPGVVLTAAERHQAIRDARSAWAGASGPDPASGVAGEAAHWLAVDAEGLRSDIVADYEARGLDRLRYLEIVGVVGRLSNIDWYVRAVGAAELVLPEPSTVPPSAAVHPDAAVTRAWVPTVGQISAPLVLDALPVEGEALRALNEAMYVDYEHLVDGNYRDVLTKEQIEYLAARTSYLNECFY